MKPRYAHQYVHILSHGPMIIVRIPTVNGPKWRHVLRALTTVMKNYSLKQKDILKLEGVVPLYDPESAKERNTREELDATYSGAEFFAAFELYDWDSTVGTFKLIRARTKQS